jgi:hypothetical protein
MEAVSCEKETDDGNQDRRDESNPRTQEEDGTEVVAIEFRAAIRALPSRPSTQSEDEREENATEHDRHGGGELCACKPDSPRSNAAVWTISGHTLSRRVNQIRDWFAK